MPPPPSCPFCIIASLLPASSHPTNIHTSSFSTYILLSTPSLIAILDIAPVTRGHTLLIPRRHCETLAEMNVADSAALGVWLPVVSRGVVRAMGAKDMDREGETGAWNVVQANGASAGQTVPHVHFHIIPRESSGDAVGESAMADAERKNLVLGEGPRVKVSKEEGEEISGLVREEIAKEVETLLGSGELVRGEGDGELWARVRDGRLKL